MALIRLQKILSCAGVCSRRKAESYILNGFVTVNDHITDVLGTRADPKIDTICFNGQKLSIESNKIYIALNKPKGYVSSCYQPNAKIVTDLVRITNRIFPVGRLDKDSMGLLLMTNDGRVHHRLSHPSFKHEKEYCVETATPASNRLINAMRKGGILLDGKATLPAKIIRISSRKFKIILTEGKNRQIRRMVAKFGNKVTALKRVRIGNIKIESLSIGSWRYLHKKEWESLVQLNMLCNMVPN